MRTFETPGPVLLTVSSPSGEISIGSTDERESSVDLIALRDDDTTREAIAETLVELRPRGDGHELVVEVPRKSRMFLGREPRIRIDVRVPHGSDVSFKTASAEVRATGTYGTVHGKSASGDVTIEAATEVRVDSASGDVQADNVTGDAKLKTASGDVRLGRVGGSLSAQVVSGDVTARTVANGAFVQGVSGDVELDAVHQGDVEVKTVSGDVVVGIEKGSRVHVDVATVSGDLRSSVELSDSPTDGEGPYVDVRGRTVSGDFVVSRAK